MPRLQLRSAPAPTLVVRDGQLSETSPFLSVDLADDLGARGSRHFSILLEPVVEVPGIEAAAEEVITCLRDEITRRSAQTATAALLAAIETANAWLYQVNAGRPALHRFRFGLTGILARGDDLFIAQAGPTQVLIGQEGELYAFPSLDTWSWRRPDDETETQPLGLWPDLEPELYHTRIEAGDLITLVSISLARVIEQMPQDVFVSGDAEAVIGALDELAEQFGIADGYAAALAVEGGDAGRDWQPHLSFLRRAADMFSHLLPEETAERVRERSRRGRRELDLPAEALHTQEYPEGASELGIDDFSADEPGEATAGDGLHATMGDGTWSWAAPTANPVEADAAYWEPWGASRSSTDDASAGEHVAHADVADDGEYGDQGEGRRKLTELLAGAVLALSAAVVGVWQISVHRDRTIHGPRDDGTLGLPRLNRYDDSPRMPDLTEVRRRLPRVPFSRLTGAISLTLVICLVGVLAFSIHTSRTRAREAQIEEMLQTAVLQRQQALELTDTAAAQAHLAAAEGQLLLAAEAGLDQERVAQEMAAITEARDQALGIERLANIQVLGGVPPAPEGVTPRVFFGNGQVYVMTDALYRLNPEGTALIRLLGTGDIVDGEAVGLLLGAAWGDGNPIAFDGMSAYRFDSTTATWSREPLGTFGTAYSGLVQANGYGGNLYVLSPASGQILKFHAGAFHQQPEDWTAGLAAADLQRGVDMQIDGRIYVLLDDGRVLNFYLSALDETVTPSVTPPIEGAVALSAQLDRPYMYIADSHNRILRLTRDGELVRQFMAPVDSPLLDNIQDMVVDDVLSVAYVLTDQALVQVRLPAAGQ